MRVLIEIRIGDAARTGDTAGIGGTARIGDAARIGRKLVVVAAPRRVSGRDEPLDPSR